MFDVLQYFRSWIYILIFPFFVLIPDFAIKYISSIYFSNPSDVMTYRMEEFKEKCSQYDGSKVQRDVVSPFDEGVKLKSENNIESEKNNISKKDLLKSNMIIFYCLN